MPSSDDVVSPTESIQSLPAAATSLRLAKHQAVPLSADQQHHLAGIGRAASRPPPQSQSEVSLPIRRPTPTTASLYASTLTPPGSRSMSPVGRVSSPARPMSLTSSPGSTRGGIGGLGGGGSGSIASGLGSVSSSSPMAGGFSKSLLESPAAEQPGDPLNLILKGFVPHVAVYSSRDTDELLREKGFNRGLWELLRPFGERVQGKVMVRDSNGSSRAWDDFAVRFVQFGDNIEMPQPVHGVVKAPPTAPSLALFNGLRRSGSTSSTGSRAAGAGSMAEGGGGGGGNRSRTASNAAEARIPLVEAVVDQHLRFAERSWMGLGMGLGLTQAQAQAQQQQDIEAQATSPYYSLYVRRLLSGLPMACHETFAHPVACVIAISSRNTSPIQTFQELYRDISQGERRLPPWVDGDFLRYYVLVHDEEKGDIVKSMALFEKMKRSLGLHCHLLRIRSTQSAETDDDSVRLPRSDWMTAPEEYADLARSERQEDGSDGSDNDDEAARGLADPTRYIFESDAAAIRAFVREMVTQSIVPTMERSVSVWNDQVASKRKGLSGRFISLSKRWTGFGGGGGGGGGGSRDSMIGGGSNSSYNVQQGFYGADASEATMRKLADYAFMMRDWKLAMSTYDILRSDFANDKAWKYHAATHEMCALALLIMPPSLSSRTKLETVAGLLEQAYFSYHTRCGSAYGALRSVVLGLELMRLRGGAAAVDESVRWGMRLLEARLTGPVGDALLRERMAVCCRARPNVFPGDSLAWGSWRRKAAFWSVLAADTWVAQARYIQAQRCLNEARQTYALLESDDGVSGYVLAHEFMGGLQKRLRKGLAVPADEGETTGALATATANTAFPSMPASEAGGDAETGDHKESADEEVHVLVDEKAEKLAKRRSRRTSLLGGGGGQVSLETAPLRRLSAAAEIHSEAEGAAADSGFGQV